MNDCKHTSTGDVKGWEVPSMAGTSSKDIASFVIDIITDLKKSWIKSASSVVSITSLVISHLGSDMGQV